MKRIEASLTDLITGLAPWLAPVPTAFLVAAGTMRWLGWPLPVAICAALIVESLGLGATNTALELREYNQSRRKTDPAAPFGLAAGLVACYVAIAILLTVALDVLPSLRTWAPAIFPFLSLTGVTVLALRADHRRRLAAIAQERAEMRALRAQRHELQKEAPKPAEIAPSYQTTGKTRTRAAALIAERPDITGAELGRQLGRSERLGRKLRAELVPVLVPAEIGKNGNNHHEVQA